MKRRQCAFRTELCGEALPAPLTPSSNIARDAAEVLISISVLQRFSQETRPISVVGQPRFQHRYPIITRVRCPLAAPRRPRLASAACRPTFRFTTPSLPTPRGLKMCSHTQCVSPPY